MKVTVITDRAKIQASKKKVDKSKKFSLPRLNLAMVVSDPWFKLIKNDNFINSVTSRNTTSIFPKENAKKGCNSGGKELALLGSESFPKIN